MKKSILKIIVFSFILNCPVYSQTGSELIYNSNGIGIKKFQSFQYQDFPQKQIYVQLEVSYNSPPNTSGGYIKLNRQTNTWFNPYNGFLNSKWNYDSWIQGWRCNPVGDFVMAESDTSVIIRHSTMVVTDCCPTEENKISTDAGLTFETSVDITLTFSNFCGFDIVSTNEFETFYFYGYNNSIIWVNSFLGSIGQHVFDIIPNLKRSRDGGFLKINPFNRNYIFTVGNSMMLSTSTSTAFFSINIPPVKKLIFSERDQLVYGYTASKLYNSTDNGLSWDSISLPYDFNVIESNPDSANILYGGTENGLYKSINKGVSWTLYNNSFTESKNVIGISKDKRSGDTLIVCTDFEVYKVWDSYLVNINNVSSNVPENFTLYQNYPNPFNPTTKIKFDIPNSASGDLSIVSLKIYDALGKLVQTLVNEKLSPGSYETEFNGSNLSSGMYFYKFMVSSSNPLETQNYTETKRMILIK